MQIANLQPVFIGSLHGDRGVTGRISVFKKADRLTIKVSNLEVKVNGPFTLGVAVSADSAATRRSLGTVLAGRGEEIVLPRDIDLNKFRIVTLSDGSGELVASASLETF